MLCAFFLLFCVFVHSDWVRIPTQSLHVCCRSGTHGGCFSSCKISRKARPLPPSCRQAAACFEQLGTCWELAGHAVVVFSLSGLSETRKVRRVCCWLVHPQTIVQLAVLLMCGICTMLCAFFLLFWALAHSDWWRIPTQSLHFCCRSGARGGCFSSCKISRKARLLPQSSASGP